jgi:hypothetical protein
MSLTIRKGSYTSHFKKLLQGVYSADLVLFYGNDD